MNTVLRRLAIVCSSAGLTACAALQATDHIRQRADHLGDDVQARQQHVNAAQAADQRRRGQHVRHPWIAGRAQPLARDVSLPPALQARTRTTLLFAPGDADLVTLADRIHRATGLPVRIAPDALLPAEAFLPRLAGDQSTAVAAPLQAGAAVPGLQILLDPARASGPGGPALPGRRPMSPALPGEAPLATLLDALSLRLDVQWRYDPRQGAIVFYRTDTRTYTVRTPTLMAHTEIELGLSGHRSGTAGTGPFASRSQSAFRAGGDATPALAAVLAKVEQLLTRAGTVRAPEGAGNTLVVTDTPEALGRVERFLAQENRILTRRVRLHFEEITIQRHDQHQAGLDWTLLFDGRGQGRADVPAPAADGLRSAASLTARIAAGPWQGSSLRMQALSELGTIVRQTRLVQYPLNRRPATYAMRETFSYVKDLQQTQSASSASAPTVTVTQDDETVGTFLTLVPDIQEDGRVLLTVAYDNTRAELDKLDLGASGNPAFVQQKTVSGEGSIQQVALDPGQPAVIAGIEQTIDTAARRRLDPRAPLLLGGSDDARQQRLLTLLVVTALPEDG